jgi:hypothetical protein
MTAPTQPLGQLPQNRLGVLDILLQTATEEQKRGEFYLFASNQPHTYRNDGPVATRFVRNVVI